MGIIKPLFILAVCCSIAFSANAKQLYFNKVEQADSYQFNYQWLDHKQQTQSIRFNLTKSALFEKFRNFRTYKPKLATRYVSRNIVNYFRKNPINDIQINYNKKNAHIAIRGSDLTKVNEVKVELLALQKMFTEKYLKKTHYQAFTNYDGKQALKPDHVVFAALSADDLKPLKALILETVSIQNIRQVTNYILGFVQSIPYSTLDSRIESSGAGYNPPLKLLWENQGDCDSKVTLTAALLRTLMPRIKMTLVFIDNHALIGIDVNAKHDELTITENGTTYLLAEPTGSALLPLGTLSNISELAITQGQYIAEVFN